ncbi:MAG TPA: protein kinase [Polyangiaceae bacterium]|jgi:serine/threonine-protein kinase|nr:protein kinase [Polyangiaceae bacterium]
MSATELRRTGEQLPKRLGRYEAFLQIGAGGMARVYLAVQRGAPGQTQLVVVKILRPEAVEDEHVLALFMDEARIAMRLSHPNVIRTREVIAEPPDYLLAMDFQNGQSLLHVLRRLGREGVPRDEHIYILSKVLAGLSYAHELKDEKGQPFGIVHRDVSPANVLVSYSGEVKLLDFGIAKATGALVATQDGVVKGKMGYAAPEQCLGKPADPRSDIYAVGVMLWEAVAGKRRASGETWQSVLQARLDDAEPQLEDVCPDAPEALTKMARRALARDPDQRYSTAREFQRDLERYLGSQSVKIGPSRVAAMLKPHFEQDRADQHRAVEAFLNTLRSSGSSPGSTPRKRLPLPGAPVAAANKPATPVVEEEQTSRIPVDAALLIMSRREAAAAAESAAARQSAPPASAVPTSPPPRTTTARPPANSALTTPSPANSAITAPPPADPAITAPPPDGAFPPPNAALPSLPPDSFAPPPMPGETPVMGAAAIANDGDRASSPSLSFAPAALTSLPPMSIAPGRTTDAFGLAAISKAPAPSYALATSLDAVAPRQKKTRIWPALLVVAGAVGLVAFGIMPLRKSSSGHAAVTPQSDTGSSVATSTPSTPKVDMVKVRISVDPPDAIVKLDGQPLTRNPFVATLPRDNALHELTAFAEGCRDAKQVVHLNQDVDLLVALKRQKGYVSPKTAPRSATAAAAAAPAHAPATAQPATQAPSPPVAVAPAAPVPPPAAPAIEPGVNLQGLPAPAPKRPDEENPYTQ